MKMNVFVTGATGFIGSHLVHKLKKNHNVTILMRDLTSQMFSKWLTETLGGCAIIQGDLSKCQSPKILRRILAEYNIDYVYHLAAQSIVSTALKDPTGTFETNILGTVNLLEACRQVGDLKGILVMSTDKVYYEGIDASEGHPLLSSGIYETSKLCEDHIAQSYYHAYGLPIKIARSCNCYGYDLNKRIIPNTIRSCLKGEPPIIFEGEDTKRQYIYVEDLVDALRFIMQKLNRPYNIGTNDILTQEEVVKKICTYFPSSPRYVKREKPLKEIEHQSLDWTLIKQLGWLPKFTFEKGIQETIKRFQKHGC